jgi:DNA adenine methylase
VCNFWRAVANDPNTVAHYADWPVNEKDLEARHLWLVNQREDLRDALGDPEYYDPKIAGWWVWGCCNWIGHGFCSGSGPWVWDGSKIVDQRQLPHLGNRGMGINRQLPHLGDRGKFITDWFNTLYIRLREVRVCCFDWSRILTESVTIRHGLTGVLLDPPYEKGNMDYGAGGMGQGIAEKVRAWCIENGNNPQIRIVLCGHAGEHDALLNHRWTIHKWVARKGYALTDESLENSASETVWASPHCIGGELDCPLFSGLGA